MRYFLTGATGFLGSHLAEALLRQGHEVTCLVRRTSSLKWLDAESLKLVYASLEQEPDETLLEALAPADHVIHAAGAIMGLCREDYFRVNAGGTRNLLEALVRSGARPRRFVLVSSTAAAGPGRGHEPVTEDFCHPVSWYGESKLEAEKTCRAFGDRVPIAIVRPPPVYGPRDTGCLDMFRALRYGLIVTFWKPTTANFVFVEDLVRGILLAARSDRAEGETFNLADSENLDVSEAMRRIASVLGKRTFHVRIPLTLAYGAALASEVRRRLTRRPDIFNWMKMADLAQTNWAVDIGKARRLLGYEPQISIEQGGALTYRWYEQEGWI